MYQGLKTNPVLTTLAVNVNDNQLNQNKKVTIDFYQFYLIGNIKYEIVNELFS